MLRWIAVALAVLVLMAASVIPPARSGAAPDATPPFASLAVIAFADGGGGPAEFGVYLGHGLVLTNWHPWTVLGQVYMKDARPSPAREVPEYDADGRADPGERALTLADCGTVLLPVGEADETCIPLARIAGAGFVFPLAGARSMADLDPAGIAATDPIHVQRLLYASQEYDIALFQVDERAVRALGVPPARLTMAPNGAGQPVQAPTIAPPHLIDGVLRSGEPVFLPETEQPALPGPWRVRSLVLQAPDYVPPGSPIFALDTGHLVGLAWRAEQDETWVTPAATWIHALFAANDAIRSEALAAVLDAAVTAPVDAPPTLGDPLIPALGNAGIDVQHVALRLDLNPETGALAGVATLRTRATLHQLASFSLDALDLDVQAVTVDGAPAPYVAKPGKLVIQLPAPLDYGTVFEVEVTYYATPQPYRSTYIPFFDIGLLHRGGRLFAFNEPDAARTWFPINDYPRDRAPYDFYLRVDASYQAIANGALVETLDNGDGTHTFHWQMVEPMASYLATVVVGRYATILDKTPDGIPILHYVYPGQEATARDVFSYTGDALLTLRRYFGPYPYAGYGHVVVPHQGVALETQSLTTLPDAVLNTDEAGAFIIITHELAHQWVGNAVPLASWSDMWLKEGLATYAEWLALADRYGESAATAARATSEQTLFTDRRTSPLIAPAPGDLLGVASYDKGAWLIHMLRRQIGDDAFMTLLREFVATFTDRPASSLDFWRLAEEVSGQDLGWFFDQWLLQGGIPQMVLYWSATDVGADVLLCRSGPGQYHFNLPLHFSDADQGVTVSLAIGPDLPRTSLSLGFVPERLTVDPDQTVLAQVQVQNIAALPDACPAAAG